MRRLAFIAVAIALAGAAVAASAGADDKRTYQAELFNAFGLVEGSELRIAGVTAGTVTDLGITPQKTALVSFEVGPEFPELKADASCSAEPQSLIAEYFLDCQPGSEEAPLEGPIPPDRNRITVQNDLVQNTLREPFRRRLQLIINEFGTALVGNSENLNAAIRAGAPALRELRGALQILGRQNRIIAQLNADSDEIFAKLAERREDVVRFIDESEDTARVSAERREDLARNFDLLDDFLFELRPTMVELGNLAREQTPLLTDLRAAAPGLNRLTSNLPRFNEGARVSLEALGRASVVGKRALTKGRDEIRQLNVASQRAPRAANLVADFLQSIDDPRNAVEETQHARDDLAEQPGEADRRVQLLEQKLGVDLDNPGYTGLEGLLNYGYIQTLSLNMFDFIGHGLSIAVVGAPEASGECGFVNVEQDYEAVGGGETTDPRNAIPCVGVLGDTQPDINFPLNLPPYDPSVCPDGSTDLSLCDPSGSSKGAGRGSLNATSPAEAQDILEQLEQSELPEGVDPEAARKKLDKARKKLEDALNLPPGVKVPKVPKPGGLGGTQNTAPSPTNDLLDFLLG